MNAPDCTLIGKVFAFIQHPGGRERLERFMEEAEACLTTADVAKLTTWSHDHINRLCQQKRLPHIPGKPHTFIFTDLMAALRQMQVGGDFGRRKAATKMTTTRKIAKGAKQ